MEIGLCQGIIHWSQRANVKAVERTIDSAGIQSLNADWVELPVRAIISHASFTSTREIASASFVTFAADLTDMNNLKIFDFMHFPEMHLLTDQCDEHAIAPHPIHCCRTHPKQPGVLIPRDVTEDTEYSVAVSLAPWEDDRVVMGCGQELASRLRAWRLFIAGMFTVYISCVLLYQFQYERIINLLPASNPSSQPVNSILLTAISLRTHIHQLAQDHHPEVDIHLEDSQLGHTGEVVGQHQHTVNSDRLQIAIGGGITSSKLKGITKDNIPEKFQFFFTLFPSFCKSASSGYDYHFYLAYDHVDTAFSNATLVQAFHTHFKAKADALCSKEVAASLSLHFVQCSHHKKPAWAQNDAMMEAFMDNVDYFYRVNDDSDLKSVGWTPAFIKALEQHVPPKVGVVGPKHKGGNTAILTYDFVHKTHVELFGFYYPRTFSDWYADDWITKVYRPDLSTKLKEIQVVHTMKLGQRYGTTWGKGKELPTRLARDQITLKRYVKYKKDPPVVADPSKMIAMSLYGSNPLDTMGAIRNAYLLPIFFPGWTLRVYVADPKSANASLVVPPRVISKLRSSGAQVAYVNTSVLLMPPEQWSYLAVDAPSVAVLLVRHPRARLDDRDAAAVQLWLQNWQPFHCIRDHPKHQDVPVTDGMWGARTEELGLLLGAPVSTLLQPQTLKSILEKDGRWRDGADFLTDLLWPLVENYALCHDSVSCNKWKGADPFPVARTDPAQFVGRYYDIQQDALSKEDIATVPECIGKKEAVSVRPSEVQFPSRPQEKRTALTDAAGSA
ncbi:hypothetical protein CAPTEDRAFT_222571 [Capitella teleta]|uniref:Uncharacterized protein n=1 Tax=Capitella teleta TaxID=283909 RepID=R7TB69_CAPTE|nr:hypothetical protein CAPTEDRAFT_222571 [Capitella teleta]|eukprot:ELT90983.1 hypothetical protein CAPTEDRAFT_222571 [Capitella teleta]